jgi:hypothetical protein
VKEGGEESLGPLDPVGFIRRLVGTSGGGQRVGPVDGPVPVLAIDDRRPGERLAAVGHESRSGRVPVPTLPESGAGGDGAVNDLGLGGGDHGRALMAEHGRYEQAGGLAGAGRAENEAVLFGAADHVPGVPPAEVETARIGSGGLPAARAVVAGIEEPGRQVDGLTAESR